MRAIHIVGPPASGKSELRRKLALAIRWPHTSIDDERRPLLRPGRWWPDDDRLAWNALRRKIEAGDIVIETAGTNRFLEPTFRGVSVLTIACYASPSIRRRRLESRVRSGELTARGRPDYVARLMAAPPPFHPADLDWDGNAPSSIDALLTQVRSWIDVGAKAA